MPQLAESPQLFFLSTSICNNSLHTVMYLHTCHTIIFCQWSKLTLTRALWREQINPCVGSHILYCQWSEMWVWNHWDSNSPIKRKEKRIHLSLPLFFLSSYEDKLTLFCFFVFLSSFLLPFLFIFQSLIFISKSFSPGKRWNAEEDEWGWEKGWETTEGNSEGRETGPFLFLLVGREREEVIEEREKRERWRENKKEQMCF